MTDAHDDSDTADIAAFWVARLDRGGLSADELIALRESAIAHPSHLRELERAARIWESLDALAALRHILARPVRATRKRTMSFAVAASAAALALAIALLHATNAPVESTFDVTGTSATVNWDINERLTLHSISAYRDTD